MDTNKILSADLLDIIFDNRNKDYGAYNLRSTYERRVKKSLLITGGLITLTISGFAFANKMDHANFRSGKPPIIFSAIPIIEEIPPVVEPPKKADPPQQRTEKFTDNIKMARPEETPPPIASQDDIQVSVIGLNKIDGPDYDGPQGPAGLNSGNTNDIVEDKKPVEPEIYPIVQIPAKFNGNWEKFLLRNLRPEVPSENNAPAGRYTVIVQFVVSLDGSISDIKPLTNLGYGLEAEAVRVLRKAENWEPGIQNGRAVKSYHKQPITFIVQDEN